MKFSLKIITLILFIGIFGQLNFIPKAHAFTKSSDTITTSRPSISTTLNGATTAGNTYAVVNSTYGSSFLAGDAVKIWDTTVDNLTLASSSADKSTLFFTTGVAAHPTGTIVTTAITAMHSVSFTTTNAVTGGSFVFTFPALGAGDTNAARPSSQAFQFNGLAPSQVQVNGTTCASIVIGGTGASGTPTITCNLASTTTVATSTTITVLIGCTAQSSGACTATVPTLINPTKTAGAGAADTWTISIKEWSANSGGGTQLDSSLVKVGTVESVSVVAHVDPTFTFTIAGVPDATALNTASYCGTSHSADTTNTGISSTATLVNLGTLTSVQINRAAQTLKVTSNSVSGYTITATSSGQLVSGANAIANAQGTVTGNGTPGPAAITAGTAAFGIHACDANSKVNTTTWGQATSLFANPSPTYYYTLVNSSSQPSSSGDSIVSEYGATVSSTTPAGDYQTVLTYVATPLF